MPRLSRSYVTKFRRDLNVLDKDILEKLRDRAGCMHRIIAKDGCSYTYCGAPHTQTRADGRILLCAKHNNQ